MCSRSFFISKCISCLGAKQNTKMVSHPDHFTLWHQVLYPLINTFSLLIITIFNSSQLISLIKHNHYKNLSILSWSTIVAIGGKNAVNVQLSRFSSYRWITEKWAWHLPFFSPQDALPQKITCSRWIHRQWWGTRLLLPKRPTCAAYHKRPIVFVKSIHR